MTRLRWRTLAALLFAAGFAAAPAGNAAAHTDFESSTPADGDVVDHPLSEITIAFTNEAQEAGDGFRVFDGTGAVRAPDTVDVVDGRVFVLGFDPPLAPGEIGVRWEVRAGDAHPIDGSFTFTLTAPPPTSPPPATTSPPTTTAAATTTQPGAAPPTVATSLPATSETTTSSETTTTVAAVETVGTEQPDTLDEFLAGDDSRAGDRTQFVGRALSLPAAVLALGGLAFMVTTLRGTAREFAALLRGLAVAGAVLATGAVVEYLGWLDQSDESFGSAWTSTPGAAMALRVVGGLALVVGALVASGRQVARPSTPPSLSAATIDASPVTTAEATVRWKIDAAPLLVIGAVVVLASFWFDGHTVTRGPRVVHAIVNTIHVAAAAVWVGGVVAFAGIVWLRHRRHEASRATELIVRFSTVATAALVAVTLAGAIMTGLVIDGPGDLTSTEWGQTLLLKTAAVAVAALIGAFNHFRLRPALEAAPDDPVLEQELRRTLTAEAVLLVFVALVTASLVAAAV